MRIVEMCGKLFSLFFPPTGTVARCEHITAPMLERTITATFVQRGIPCLAPLPYTHALVRTTVQAAKYYDHEYAALLLAEVLAPVLAEELGERRMAGFFTKPVLVPIPLHQARLRERGFNQCERLGAHVLALLGDSTIVMAPQGLVRTKNTAHQARQLAKTDRERNMRKAFCVPDAALVAHRDILLLDDVITTGATMRCAARVLMGAGARSVLCVAAAH
jgi:ComF family protein